MEGSMERGRKELSWEGMKKGRIEKLKVVSHGLPLSLLLTDCSEAHRLYQHVHGIEIESLQEESSHGSGPDDCE